MAAACHLRRAPAQGLLVADRRVRKVCASEAAGKDVLAEQTAGQETNKEVARGTCEPQWYGEPPPRGEMRERGGGMRHTCAAGCLLYLLHRLAEQLRVVRLQLDPDLLRRSRRGDLRMHAEPVTACRQPHWTGSKPARAAWRC